MRGLTYAAAAPWPTIRERIVRASVGIASDLVHVLDRVDPTRPGEGFPLTHREAFETVRFDSEAVVLRPEHFVVGSVKDAYAQTALVAAYTALGSNETLGYVVRFFDIPDRACHRKYLMFAAGDPRTKGVGMQVAATWDTFVPRLGIATSTMEAAYVGRLVWALEGFDFNTDATCAMVAERFGRFMERFGLDAADLYFRRDDGSSEPFAFDKLRHAWDFAHVVSKKGTIRLPTRTSNGKDDEAVLDVGRAFMLGDFRRPELADCVCPDYFCQRPTDPDSPNQWQARAYAAARAARERKS